jgi:hypothetical protein
MLGLTVQRPGFCGGKAEMRLRMALELSSPRLLVETLELHEHRRWCVVPSAVGFCVPWRLEDAVASARSGHARWIELELAVHPDSPHRVGSAGRGGA